PTASSAPPSGCRAARLSCRTDPASAWNWTKPPCGRICGRQPGLDGPEQEFTNMSTGGLSKARLGRMHDVMAGYVERGNVPGLVTLVSRRGEVHIDALG